MTTDLRDALREAAHTITEYASSPRVMADVARYRALADAPPTVAELLPMVDATHRLEWTDADDDERIAQLEGTVIKSYFRSPGKGADAWSPIGLLASDTTRPAKLVEVSP